MTQAEGNTVGGDETWNMEPRIGGGGRSKSFLDLLEWRVDVALENVQTTVRRGHKYPLRMAEGGGSFPFKEQ